MEIIAYTELTADFAESFENLVINPFEQISYNLRRLKKELRMVINQRFFLQRLVTYGFIPSEREYISYYSTITKTYLSCLFQ